MSKTFPSAPPAPELTEKDPSLLSGLDERIFLDQRTNKWVFDSDDGSGEYEYDFTEKEWVRRSQNARPAVKRPLQESQLDEEEEANKIELKRLKKERLVKLKSEIARLKKEQAEKAKPTGERISTAVHVSNLPLDITTDEIASTFSKYGLLLEDYNTGKPRVMLQYEGEEFKREALIIYLSRESVAMAVEMLDDTLIRPSGDKIKVSEAEFLEHHEEKNLLTEEEEKLIKLTNERMKAKVTNWDDERDERWKAGRFNEAKRRILDKIVVIDQMFRVEELQQDPLLEMDLKEDIQEECNNLGIGNDITKIIIENTTGRVKIKFNNPDLSSACIENFHNRYFDGLKLVAHVEGDTKIY